MREKVGKSRNTVIPMIWGSGGSKSRIAKAAGAEPAGQMRDEKLHAVVARSTFANQNVQNTPFSDHFWKLRCRKSARHNVYKTPHVRATFGRSNVEKVHTVVARSIFRSENVQNTPLKDHFWKLRCRKSARRCGTKHISKWRCTKHHMFAPLLEVPMWKKCTLLVGAKHILKWKCTKHYMFAPLLEVQMSKKCTPLWHEAHFEVKMLITPGVRTTFAGSDVTSLRFASLQYTTLYYTTTTTTTTELHFTTLRYNTLHHTTLHYTLHYTTLPSTTLHYVTLYSTTLQLHLRLPNYTPLHEIILHYTTFHYTPLHYTTLHYTTLHWMTLQHR